MTKRLIDFDTLDSTPVGSDYVYLTKNGVDYKVSITNLANSIPPPAVDLSTYVRKDAAATITAQHTYTVLPQFGGSNFATQSWVNSQLSSYALTSYVDTQDAATLVSANAYTDAEIAAIDLSDYSRLSVANTFTAKNTFQVSTNTEALVVEKSTGSNEHKLIELKDNTGSVVASFDAAGHLDAKSVAMSSINDPTLRIENEKIGYSSFTQDVAGVELVSAGMNATSKYTSFLKFGSNDTELSTTPSFGAAIAGSAPQSYANPTTFGMGMDFFTNPPNAGVAPAKRMELTSNGNLLIADSTFSDNISKLYIEKSGNYDPNLGNETHIFLKNLDGTAGEGAYTAGIAASRVNSNRPLASMVGYQSTTNSNQGGWSWFTSLSTDFDYILEEAMTLNHAGDLELSRGSLKLAGTNGVDGVEFPDGSKQLTASGASEYARLNSNVAGGFLLATTVANTWTKLQFANNGTTPVFSSGANTAGGRLIASAADAKVTATDAISVKIEASLGFSLDASATEYNVQIRINGVAFNATIGRNTASASFQVFQVASAPIVVDLIANDEVEVWVRSNGAVNPTVYHPTLILTEVKA